MNSVDSGWPKCTDCSDFLFCNPKIVRNVRIFFFKLYGLYGLIFFNFHSFQQIFHENIKKKISTK